jgi:hypothetical protein
VLFGPGSVRDPRRVFATCAAASNVFRSTSGSWVGCSDHTHVLGGLTRPPFFVARRFHTM